MRITFNCLLLIAFSLPVWSKDPSSTISADRSLARLMSGNSRYVSGKEQHPDETLQYRKQLADGQHPFAVVLTCADSRVAPELVFDQGLGDLFVIRVAGNIASDDVLASMEYAVEHLHTKLILVLGHEKCGAVSAAVQGVSTAGHLGILVAAIQPAVGETRDTPGDKVHNCVLANARRVAAQVRQSDPILKDLVQSGGVKVIAADYSLDSGTVTLLDEPQH